MTGHDLMAAAVAQVLLRDIRQGAADWAGRLPADARITASRTWPVPDFVVTNPSETVTLAAEFKPPDQSKREYLTGLGQAVAYTRGFHFGLLILPDKADDGYPISDHVVSVLGRAALADLPVGVAQYDPATFSSDRVDVRVVRPLPAAVTPPPLPASLEESLFAKFREASPHEIGRLLQHLYIQRFVAAAETDTVRQRGFDALWDEIQTGNVLNSWAGRPRVYNTDKTGVYKNYTNFIYHLGWIEMDGSLTAAGLKAHELFCVYQGVSAVFLDYLAHTLLTTGKHLVLFTAIEQLQNAFLVSNSSGFADDKACRDYLEARLIDRGLVKLNPGRGAAAIKGVERDPFKSEKQIWKALDLVVPTAGRVKHAIHRGRGFVINWPRITELVRRTD